MSDSAKAVFLSYASQDAEAAKRICDALRQAGVEVWFDQSELVGGDAWDAKIKKQIRECALFVPIITPATNARAEGYFRREWKQAVERTHDMADDVPFLFPIVIGDVTDATARVPDKFREVQWTRLKLEETPGELAGRIAKLLSTGSLVGGVLPPDSFSPSGHEVPPTGKSSSRWEWWMIFPIAGTIMGLMFAAVPLAKLMQGPRPKPAAPPAAAPVAPPVSAARELVAKVRGLILALDATREDFALAEEYCQRALKLDPDDGEVWAVYAQVHSAFGYRGWDTSSERREQTRTTAERAMRLAPQSAAARLAQAGAWAAFGINREEREKLLREILRDEPDNQEVLRFLAVTVLPKPGGLEEALALNERSAALPGGDPLALFNNARYLWTAGQPAKGYEVLLRALAQRKFTSALVLKMGMELTWRGDLAAAEETLKQIPSAALQEDRANYSAGLLRYYQRDAGAALAIWRAFPRDFYVDFIFDGPKGLLLGLADALDHRDAAARTEWRAALQEVGKKIAAVPNRAAPYYSQAYLLACLGEKAAASEALRTHEQLAQIKYAPGQGMTLALAKVYARLGRFDEILAHSPAGNLAVFRISPDFDTLRADPRFEKFLRDNLPESASRSAPKSQAQDPGPPSSPLADSKSVAVLAFANLSDDKANEYFSDGISEELLNVLAKVPGLKVSARTSAFYFKGKEVPIPEIARQLGVAYVVEGSVRKSGDKVRITAQLIKAADGFHVWSDTFTRDLKDIFAVQDEIAGLIAKNLELKLGTVRAVEAGSAEIEAYRLYWEARQAWNRRDLAGYDQAETLLNRALALAPRFAKAHAALADVWVLRGEWDDSIGSYAERDGAAVRRPLAKVDEALTLDPQSAEVYASRGNVLGAAWQFVAAENAFRTAITLNPNFATAHQWLGRQLLTLGRLDEALAALKRAAELDPLSQRILDNYAWALRHAGRYAEALNYVNRALALQPDAIQARSLQAALLADLGREEEALAALRAVPDEVTFSLNFRLSALGRLGRTAEIERRLPGIRASNSRDRSLALALLGRTTEALAAFKAERILSPDADLALFEPGYDSLRSHPEWNATLARIGLTEAHARAQAGRAAHLPERPEVTP